ncbi:hypothetical protein GWK48_06985 [Metallosphaera tengchongensis]|uniref:Uncharacterized protein n=1 Tax=Metallosphaera tengchongensis TaxID=1532350 RepID=A0A6N0NYD8_9CREN|nr:hypothetical protein [Metallosphaera tengchongensis]QKR00151.1 hypothetical protein GWK48_06985 [Metallosphaera tengchongensis]
MEPFYFKSYEKVIGKASDVNELEREMGRLVREDPACVEWHLKQGHLVNWLNYIGERGLAEMLKGVSNPKEALSRIVEYRAMTPRREQRRKGRSKKFNI